MSEFGRIETNALYTKADVHLGVIAAAERDTCEHEARLLGLAEIRCDRCDIDAALARVAPRIAERATAKLQQKLDAIEAIVAAAEQENAARPPLFNGARFPARVQTSAIRAVLGGAA